ncbi:MAG: glycosyltransferase [Saccharolobus sp.]|uniref:glycosyltransferase family 2 protein n=1 Tax=Saccharolobus TaxID=2100760 RepID=UPI001F0F39BD|nr:glycosyltransferase [Saccharolobus shibatae]MCH4816713.1 glycosyltransferase [Saccharolobus shibatae]
MPYISVIITAYNRKQFLLDAIKSVLNQSLNRNEYEILVAKNFKDDNIDNYLYNNKIKNISIFRSVNNSYIAEAVKLSSGEIISFLDDDDLFLPTKLENV